jgi:threonylcarbamoyladenosine tRNA methylthiotransferase MtaB
VVANAREIAGRGVREIVLTGVNIGDFGNGTAVIEGVKPRKEALFSDLIQALDEIEEVSRFRISSIEPNLCTSEIIEFVAKSRRFAPHFHIPLQSGNNKQLRAMRRRYQRELYQERVEEIKKWMPFACIGVDVIVGFPGETEADFEETYHFISSLDISYLHVFTFSERDHTPAASMPDIIPLEERRRRNALLTSLSEQKRMHFYGVHLGQIRPVLFEKSKSPGKMSGFTDNYIKVETIRKEESLHFIENRPLLRINREGLVEC